MLENVQSKYGESLSIDTIPRSEGIPLQMTQILMQPELNKDETNWNIPL